MNKSLYNKRNWVNYGRWVQPTLSGTFWCHWSEAKSLKEVSGKNFHPMLFLDGNSLTTKSDQQQFQKILQSLNSKPKVKSLIGRIEQVGNRVEKNHLGLLNQKNLDYKEYLPKLFYTYNEVVGFWWFCLQLGDELEKFMIENNIATHGLADYVEAKAKKTWLQQEAIEIRKLASKIKNPTKNNKLILNHVRKYSWFGTHHWTGDGYTVAKCIAQIKEEQRKSHPIKKVKIGSKSSPLWDLMTALTYWRTHSAELTAKVVFESRPKLIEFGKKFGLNYESVTYLSHLEILQAIKTGKLTLPKNFTQRRRAYGSYLENSKETILVGKDLSKLITQTVEEKNDLNTTLKGSVASVGKSVKGRVKVVISPKDFSKFKKGEVLVAPETTPDFVPLMKIASAVLTDRGGITSHAAIVSRELKILCIVGLGNATKTLKDGDLIEVDANKGIVRLVSRKALNE